MLIAPENFSVVDGIGMFRPVGTFHLREAVALMSQGIAHAREQGLSKLLVVTTRLKGFKPPGVAARIQMVREWAEAAGGHLTMAVVARREFIDPERIGVVSAGTVGIIAHAFESESEAIAWLGDH